MKMSRFSLLLAVALFIAPVTAFGEEKLNQDIVDTKPVDTNPVDTKPVDTKPVDKNKMGYMAAAIALLTTVTKPVGKGLDTVADYSFKLISDRLLNYFTSLKGGKIEANIPTINRLLVSATFATALYAAYKLYKSQQQNDDADDIDLDFDSEENDKYRYNN